MMIANFYDDKSDREYFSLESLSGGEREGEKMVRRKFSFSAINQHAYSLIRDGARRCVEMCVTDDKNQY